MAAQIEPGFLVMWVRAELEAQEDLAALTQLAARAERDGLDREEAELDAAGALAEKRGLLAGLETAAGDLWLAEVREARGAAERLERNGQTCLAFLRATAGAAARLQQLAAALAEKPWARVAELTSPLGGTPGCSIR